MVEHKSAFQSVTHDIVGNISQEEVLIRNVRVAFVMTIWVLTSC